MPLAAEHLGGIGLHARPPGAFSCLVQSWVPIRVGPACRAGPGRTAPLGKRGLGERPRSASGAWANGPARQAGPTSATYRSPLLNQALFPAGLLLTPET